MEIQRESMDTNVLIVGAGPAGLAAAIHLTNLIETARAKGELKGAAASDEFTMMIIEKSAELGDHALSGAVLDPKGLDELIPDWRERKAPLTVEVKKENLYYLSEKGTFGIPYTPPSMNNHGCYIVSLNQLVKWLGNIAEEKEIDVFTGMAGSAPIIEDGLFKGIITDDKGLDKDGKPKGNFEPGMELRANITILAEGPRGSMTRETVKQLNLDKGKNPQNYLTGVKELWEVPTGRMKAGTVYHTLGYPLGMGQYGGSFIYAMSDELISIGLASALNYQDPRFDPHGAFNDFKRHPLVSSLLEGGKMIRYGAKTIGEGGYFAMPKLYHDGLMLIGDTAGFLNSLRLKGIHLAMKTGIMAAETAFEALNKEDYSTKTLSNYHSRYRKSWAFTELWQVRNFHQGFDNGMIAGMVHFGAQMLTGGRGFTTRLNSEPDHLAMKKLIEMPSARLPIERKFDGELTIDKLTDVYASGAKHEENQPAHLRITDINICNDRCTEEYGNPCINFCPASVYEMVDDEQTGKKHLQISPSNCVHCKTCDIADPYGNITWTPPEGGGGPVFSQM
ncbi:MAG: electron transfer flavoprotein-ubiquinone oxidoreductase [Candidatus Hatepunaea meridiana]|nr:electron transfer flavoprotein-ubiquinone oxidoreductase [Candidatus Hatepunaea meridiana]